MNNIELLIEHNQHTLGELAGEWWNWFLSENPDRNNIINKVLFLKGPNVENNKCLGYLTT